MTRRQRQRPVEARRAAGRHRVAGARLLLLGWIAAGLIGCALPPARPESPAAPPAGAVSPTRAALQAHYQEWDGVGYRAGGTGRSGVDCSGFVQLTYHQRFGRQLPRTTELQSRIGRPVSERRRRPGDLVFFKTGVRSRHVGIYLGEGQFLHVSKSVGVTVSDLANPYWASAYWQTRRPQ